MLRRSNLDLPSRPGPAVWATSDRYRNVRLTQSDLSYARLNSESLRQEVNALPWFHEIDLGDGVVTPGRTSLKSLRALADMFFQHGVAGKSVLDIGAYDGFFSLDAKRRGASRVLAEVIERLEQVAGLLHHDDGAERAERRPRKCDQLRRGEIHVGCHCCVRNLYFPRRRKSSASSMIAMPSSFALSNLLPASAPTTSRLVAFDTESVTLPPAS